MMPGGSGPPKLYMLVMERFDKTLDEIIRSESCGDDWPAKAHAVFLQVTDALRKLHKANFLHGDIKPRNIISGGALHAPKFHLVDFDASRPIGVAGAECVVGPKISPAYAPPEALVPATEPPLPCAECHLPLRWRHEPPQRAPPPAPPDSGTHPLYAQASWDAWSLGATLYHMLARRPLFNTSITDTFQDGDADARALALWDTKALAQKLHHLPAGACSAGAANLLERLLALDPKARPSLDSLQYHPYVCGYKYDVFVSYRRKPDSALALALVKGLEARGLLVFFDETPDCLTGGGDYQLKFMSGLRQSRIFVPVVTKGVLVPLGENPPAPWSALRSDSPCDNVLLEYSTAFELSGRGRQAAPGELPLEAGNVHSWLQDCVPVFADGFDPSTAPGPPGDLAAVAAVEDLLRTNMASLGACLLPPEPASPHAVWKWITKANGKFTSAYTPSTLPAAAPLAGGGAALSAEALDWAAAVAVPVEFVHQQVLRVRGAGASSSCGGGGSPAAAAGIHCPACSVAVPGKSGVEVAVRNGGAAASANV